MLSIKNFIYQHAILIFMNGGYAGAWQWFQSHSAFRIHSTNISWPHLWVMGLSDCSIRSLWRYGWSFVHMLVSFWGKTFLFGSLSTARKGHGVYLLCITTIPQGRDETDLVSFLKKNIIQIPHHPIFSIETSCEIFL